jgi:hypothetical protein
MYHVCPHARQEFLPNSSWKIGSHIVIAYKVKRVLCRYLSANWNCWLQECDTQTCLTVSNPIFLPPAYPPALIYFGWEICWWITCNYPAVLKEKNRNRKSTTCTICWLKSVLREEKRREQENQCWTRSKIGSERVNLRLLWSVAIQLN